MTDEQGVVPPRWAPVVIRVRPAAVLMVLVAALGAIVLRNLFVAAHRTIAWTVAAALIALLLIPLVDRLDRHLPKILALLITLVGFAAIAGALWAATRHQIISGIDEITVEAPKAASALEAKYGWAKDAKVVERVDDLLARVNKTSTTDEVRRIVGTTTAYFVPGILTLFLMVFGRRMVEGGLQQIDEPRRARLGELLHATVSDGRRQILLAVAQAVAVGLVVWATAVLLGLPAAFLLALTAAVFAILPAMGIVIGGLPAILMAVALEGVVAGLAFAGIVLGLQLVEIFVARPWIRRRAGDVGPALIIVVVLLAYQLYGIGGAIYSYLMLVFALAFVHQLARRGDSLAISEAAA